MCSRLLVCPVNTGKTGSDFVLRFEGPYIPVTSSVASLFIELREIADRRENAWLPLQNKIQMELCVFVFFLRQRVLIFAPDFIYSSCFNQQKLNWWALHTFALFSLRLQLSPTLLFTWQGHCTMHYGKSMVEFHNSKDSVCHTTSS